MIIKEMYTVYVGISDFCFDNSKDAYEFWRLAKKARDIRSVKVGTEYHHHLTKRHRPTLKTIDIYNKVDLEVEAARLEKELLQKNIEAGTVEVVDE